MPGKPQSDFSANPVFIVNVVAIPENIGVTFPNDFFTWKVDQ